MDAAYRRFYHLRLIPLFLIYINCLVLTPSLIMVLGASMSVWLGITSIIFYSTGFIAIILGGVAIVLALLSRGNSKKLTRKAVIGLVIGIIGVSITYITVAVIAYRIFTDPSVVAVVEAFRQSNTIDNYNNLYDAIMNSTGVIPQ